jgi:iron complex outermembrane receptor protein
MKKKKDPFFKRLQQTCLFLFCLLFSLNVSAQNLKRITGTVLDEFNEPAIGASVTEKGTDRGTATDMNGNFELSVGENAVLVVSYIGYSAQEIQVGNQTSFSIVLKEDAQLLEEVVVIGYGTVKKNDLTGSVTAIDATRLNKGLATSPADLLAGKVAGVNITTSGAPGGEAKIRIRGGSSMATNNDPLIIIDGVPVDNQKINGMSNPLSAVNTNDIETFTVLKDASATAIYGSRASNGVILITTKKGVAGKPQISYNGNVSVSSKTGDVDVMSSGDFINFVTTKFGAGSEQVAALGTADTNWQDEIFRTAISTDHNIGISGKAGILPFRVSVGYTNENGILKTSNFERYTGMVNLTPSFLNDDLKVALNIKGMHNKNRFADKGAINSATQYNPTKPVYAEGSQYGNGYHMELKPDGTPIDIALANPLAILEEKNDRSTVDRVFGNIQVDYILPFFRELKATANIGYDYSKSDGSVVLTDNSPMTWTWGNYKTGWGDNRNYDQKKTNSVMDYYLTFDKEFGVHHTTLMAGYSWQHFYRIDNNSYPYSEKQAQTAGKPFYRDPTTDPTESYLVSFYGRANYTLLNRYMLTATLRDDGSSKFGPGNKWGLFPSAALAWRINNESFMVNTQRILSDLKLRLGWGITGQQDVGTSDYPWMARYGYSKSGANYFFGDRQIILIRPYAYDENLKWEETTTYNAGIDYGFLGNRITGTIDVYYRKTEDLINNVPIPALTNFSNWMITNYGNMENKGVEFNITGKVLKTKDLDWNLSYNIAYNKNKITNLTTNDDPDYIVSLGGIDGGTGNNILAHKVGHPRASFYVYEQVYDEQGHPIEGVFVDQDKDGVITESDKIIYKNAVAPVTMGLSSQLGWKDWNLNFSLRSNIGNYLYNNVQANRESTNTTFDPSGFLKNRVNSAVETNFFGTQYMSSYYVQNASFLKMDNITLGYDFSKLVNNKFNGRIYCTVQNPFVITKYKGLDPEVNEEDSSNGIDKNTYPHARVVIFGIGLTF